MPGRAPLQQLIELAKQAKQHKPTREELAELVAMRLAQANGQSYRPNGLSNLTRLQALDQAGFDISQPKFYVDRVRNVNSPMYGVRPETWDVKNSPLAAIDRYGPSTDEKMVMLGERPSNPEDSYALRNLSFSEELRDLIIDIANRMKAHGYDPTDAFNSGGHRPYATFMAYPRKGRMKRPGWWWEQPYSTEDLVPIYGYPDDAGNFKRGGRVG